MSDTKDLFKVDEKKYVPATTGIDSLFQLAVEKDFDAEKMQKVIDMVNAERARMSKQAFEDNFAEMQKELPAIVKDRSAKDRNGKDTYKYATLESILEQVQPIILKHGFSYSWRNETVKDGATRVWCVISGYGHAREDYFDIPIMEASAWTNAIQQMGSATSYGKRYSLCSALGIIIKEEDDDAHSFDLSEIMAATPVLNQIKGAKTLDELAKIWTGVYNEYKSDMAILTLLTEAKDQRKKELSK